jgi:hypothetical protein
LPSASRAAQWGVPFFQIALTHFNPEQSALLIHCTAGTVIVILRLNHLQRIALVFDLKICFLACFSKHGLLISAGLSVTKLELLGDGFTKADEGFLRQTQAAVFPVKSSPLPQKFFSSERESH